ncbi:hypothetical protein Plhal304r1_c055g0141421 [Plasmopara halstedii]
MAQKEIITQQQLVKDPHNDKSKSKAEEEHANAIELQTNVEFMHQVNEVVKK